MSQENMEVVRNYFKARSERGREGVFEFLSPNVVWESRSDLPDAQTYRGHDEVRSFFWRFRDVLDDMWFEAEDFILAGERVVVPLRWGGRGKSSGVVVDEREAWVFAVQDDVIVRVEEYGTTGAALEAVGLPE
jgi:ketosteroid isomerase-like protein